MKQYYSFLAAIHDGTVEYECISNRLQEYTENMEEDGSDAVPAEEAESGGEYPAVTIKSGGYLDGNISSIVIDGTGYSNNSKGINIVVYDNDAKLVLDSAVFNTAAKSHASKHSWKENLYKYQNYLIYGNADA